MDPAAAEKEMIYLIQDRENGPVTILTPGEFHSLFGSSLPKATVAKSTP
jgi:hypothetical protein